MLEIYRDQALQDDVPIMSEASLDAIIEILKAHQCTHILEVGSAVGYSASYLAASLPTLHIDTIERDATRAAIARDTFEALNLTDRIRFYEMDAFEFRPKQTYDAIIIDAAKAQNGGFLRLFSPYANDCIIIDNLDFHGFVDTPLEQIESRNLRAMVRKIQSFKTWIEAHPLFDITYLDVGDGLGVVTRKEYRHDI